jgi:hypothetical protein
MARFVRLPTLVTAIWLGGAAGALAQAENPAALVGEWTSNINVPYTVAIKGGTVTWSTPMGETGSVTSGPAGLQTTWMTAAGMQTATGVVLARDNAGRPVRVQWSNGLVIDRVGAQPASPPFGGAAPGSTPGSAPPFGAQQAVGLLGALIAQATQPKPAAAPPTPVSPTTYPPPPPAAVSSGTTMGTFAIPPDATAPPAGGMTSATEPLSGPVLRPGPGYFERVIGGLAPSSLVQVAVVPPGGTPLPMPKQVPLQAALFYSHVVCDLLGEDDVFDLSQKVLVVKMRQPGMPPGSPEELLTASLGGAFARAADARVAMGPGALAAWYGAWAEWFGRLGVNLNDPSVVGATSAQRAAWAAGQPPEVLKAHLSAWGAAALAKTAVTPVQVP